MTTQSFLDNFIPLEEDPSAFNEEVDRIAKAIKQIESGGKYGATSRDQGVGAYQFTGTWDEWSSQFARKSGIGKKPLPMTPENQDAVAKFKIGQWLSQGLGPKQIASKWNSGSTQWEGKVGVNKYNVPYDVPAYVNEKFWPTYQRLGGRDKADPGGTGVLDRIYSVIGPSEAEASEIPPDQLGNAPPKRFIDDFVEVDESTESPGGRFIDNFVGVDDGQPIEPPIPQQRMSWSEVPGETANLAKKGFAFSLADLFSHARMPESAPDVLSGDLIESSQQRKAIQPYIEDVLGTRPVSEKPRSFMQQSVVGLGDAPMLASPTGISTMPLRMVGSGIGALQSGVAFNIGALKSTSPTVVGVFQDAIRSAYDSVFTEGSHGALGQNSGRLALGSYYDKLPTMLQTTADVIVEGAVDPINWAQFGIPALTRLGAKAILPEALYKMLNRTGTLPLSRMGKFNIKQHKADVDKLNAMEEAERAEPIPLTDIVRSTEEPITLTDVYRPPIDRRFKTPELKWVTGAKEQIAQSGTDVPVSLLDVVRDRPSVYTPGSAIDQLLESQRRTQSQTGRNILEPLQTERPGLPTQELPPQAQRIVNEVSTALYPKVSPELRAFEESLRRASSNADTQLDLLRGGRQEPRVPVEPKPTELPFEPTPGVDVGRQNVGNIQNLIRDSLESKIGARSRAVGEPPATQGVEPAQAYVKRVAEVIEENKTKPWLGLKDTTKELLSSEKGAVRLFDDTTRRYKELMKANPYYKHIEKMVGEVTPPKTKYGESFVHEVLDDYYKIKQVTPETYKKIRMQSSFKDVMAFKARELADDLGEFRKYPEIFKDLLLMEDVIARGGVKVVSGKRPPVTDAVMFGGRKGFVGPLPKGVKSRPVKWIYEVKHPGGITLEQAKKNRTTILNYIEQTMGPGSARKAQEAVRNTWQKFTEEEILGNLVDRGQGGLFSEDVAKEIAREHGIYATHKVLHYVPQSMDMIPGLPSSKYYSIANQKVLKRAFGSEKQIEDPLIATHEKWAEVTDFANRNRIAYSATDEMMKSTVPEVRGMIHPIAESKQEFMRMTKAGLKPVNADWKHTLSPSEWKPISRYTKDGAQSFLVHRDVADILTASAGMSAPRFVTALNSAFRAMATSSYIPFVFRNAARDAFMAYTTGPYGKSPIDFGRFIADWTMGLTEGAMHEFFGASPKMEEAIKSGMGMGFTATWKTPEQIAGSIFKKRVMDMTNKELTKAVLVDTPGKLFEQIEKLSSAIELAPRYAVYRRALKKGMSAEDAAMLARTSTIDFNRAGAALRTWNQFVPFLNARVQARYSLLEAATDPARRWDTAVKAMNIGVAGGSLAMLNHYLFGDLIYKVPGYIRKDNFVFLTGSKTDPKTGRVVPTYFKIAKGDVGSMATNPLEFAIDRAYKRDPPGFGELAAETINSLSPLDMMGPKGTPSFPKLMSGLMPPSVKSIVENASNFNFYTGHKIEPSGMERKPRDLRYKEDTPEVFKQIAKLTSKIPGLDEMVGSPLQLQNLARGLGAGYGASGGSPKTLLKSLGEVFYSEKGGEEERQTADAYYSMKQEYEYTRSRAKQLAQEGNMEEAIQLLQGWNKEVPTWTKKIEDHGMKDEGGLRSFYFTNEKIRNVLRSQNSEPDDIEDKLKKRTRRQ